MDEFDHYTTAILCGGPTRVAQVAVLLLRDQHRIRIFRGTHRVEVLLRDGDADPVQAAVLDEIPGAGRPLGQVIAAVAASPEVDAIGEAMRETGLMRGRRRRRRPTRQGRALRLQLAEEPVETPPELLALHGPAGLEDAWMREVLESADPEPVAFGRRRWRGHRDLEASGLPDRQYDGGLGGGSDF